MEMALYLELFVLQICGIRPALRRGEDFLKDSQIVDECIGRASFS
ncbi:hypothetical protein SLEP1_g33709 [Rubroshorea leprosula]|uniref:Uncharacterized protein n=1 Tax=Rubroshorea leprosula TaxID=152421 RepID=A0AAV5KHG4_9ROSI|nr:hypothetical protein SLEP1_g33709 [Rubroshorea leprosula]